MIACNLKAARAMGGSYSVFRLQCSAMQIYLSGHSSSLVKYSIISSVLHELTELRHPVSLLVPL